MPRRLTIHRARALKVAIARPRRRAEARGAYTPKARLRLPRTLHGGVLDCVPWLTTAESVDRRRPRLRLMVTTAENVARWLPKLCSGLGSRKPSRLPDHAKGDSATEDSNLGTEERQRATDCSLIPGSISCSLITGSYNLFSHSRVLYLVPCILFLYSALLIWCSPRILYYVA